MTIKLALASMILGTSTLAVAGPSASASTSDDDCEHDGTSLEYGAPGSGYDPSGYTSDAPSSAYPGAYTGAYAGYAGQQGYAQPTYPQQYPSQYQAPDPSYQPARWSHARWHRPVTLASDIQFEGPGRRFITVGPQAGRFARLELTAQHGRTFVKQVYVQFDDGQEQVVRNIDREVSRRNGLTLDLDGGRRSIRRIVVYGEGQRGRWHAGTLSLIAS